LRFLTFSLIAAFAVASAWVIDSRSGVATSSTTQGSVNCDFPVDTSDGILIVREEAGVPGMADCLEELGDVNCDDSVDLLDSLLIFKYVANLGVSVTGCPPIGQPLVSPSPIDSTTVTATASETPTATPTPSPSPTLSPAPTAASGFVYSDPSDFEAFGTGGVGTGAGDGNNDGGAGDTSANSGRRFILRFDVGSLAGSVNSATLHMTIEETRKENADDGIPPYGNPGLGDLSVICIEDPGGEDAIAYGSPSLCPDPGVLIASGTEAPAAELTIDVTDALQNAIDNDYQWLALRLQTATETDGDSSNDLYFFWSGNHDTESFRPRIDWDIGP
jgi:hypothetical protein